MLIVMALLTLLGGSEHENAGINVSIAVPTNSAGNSRDINSYGSASHFHVVITNTSKAPIRLFDEVYSWGRYNLSFEITDPSGRRRLVTRTTRPYHKNFPRHFIVGPGEHFVRAVNFADGTWKNFPLPKTGRNMTLRMRAIFQIKPDEASKEFGVWTGTVSSLTRS